jgi:hypothetical protein
MKVTDSNGNVLEVVVSDHQLIEELQSRGYMTDLLFNRNDVQNQIDNINEIRKDKGLESIEIDDDEKEDILERVGVEWFIERINESLFDEVSDYINED